MKTIGVAWFRADEWPALLNAADDRANLPSTFAEFEALAGGKIANFDLKRGVRLEKVMISVPALLTWCGATGRSVDGPARAGFAAIMLARREMN